MTFAGTLQMRLKLQPATDTITIGLPNDVTIGNDLTVTGDVGGATATNYRCSNWWFVNRRNSNYS